MELPDFVLVSPKCFPADNFVFKLSKRSICRAIQSSGNSRWCNIATLGSCLHHCRCGFGEWIYTGSSSFSYLPLLPTDVIRGWTPGQSERNNSTAIQPYSTSRESNTKEIFQNTDYNEIRQKWSCAGPKPSPERKSLTYSFPAAHNQ